MNRTPNVELVLREYFADDGTIAPDHILDVVADRIGRQAQGRAWLGSRRNPTPRLTLRWALLAAAAVALVGTGLWFIGRSQQHLVVPSLPLPTASNSARPSPGTVVPFADLGFHVPFRLSLVGGWAPPSAGFDTPTSVTFTRGTVNAIFESIADTRVRPPGTDASAYEKMEPWPSDLHAWLLSLRYCTVRDVSQATVGRQPALVADFECSNPPGETNIEAISAASLAIANPNGPFVQYGTTTYLNRIVEVRTDADAGIAVILVAPVGTFDANAAALEALLSTLSFDVGPAGHIG